jgi:ferrous-iron efflux pump FieF
LEDSQVRNNRKNLNQVKKIRTAQLSLGTGIFLSVTKFSIAFITGSLGILSSAIDNIGDIFMSAVTLISVKKSSAPPDKNHPYGHGKIEALATAFQVAVITSIGAWIIYESIRRLIEGYGPRRTEAGIGIMIFSVIVSFLVARKIERAGRETESPALIADSLHFKTDVYSGSGILIALFLVKITGNPIFDSLAGLVIGIFIIQATFPLIKGVLDDLLDRELPEEVKEKIDGIIGRHKPMVVDVHAMRTRKAGSRKHVDFHLVVCRLSTVEEAHSLAAHLEMEIEDALGDSHVVTHLEPCEEECPMEGRCEGMREKMLNLRQPGKERDREKYYFGD